MTSESQNRVILQNLDCIKANDIHLLCGSRYFQLHLKYHSKNLQKKGIPVFFLAKVPKSSLLAWSN